MQIKFGPETIINIKELCSEYRPSDGKNEVVLEPEGNPFVSAGSKTIDKVKLRTSRYCNRGEQNVTLVATIPIEEYVTGKTVRVRVSCRGCLWVSRWRKYSDVCLGGINHNLPVQQPLL